CEQTVRFAELSPARRLITHEPREVRPLDADEGTPCLGAGALDQRLRSIEFFRNRRPGGRALGCEQHPSMCEPGADLDEGHSMLASRSECAAGGPACLLGVAGSEMCLGQSGGIIGL